MHCQELEILGDFLLNLSMEEETFPSVSKSKLFLLKLIMTKLIAFEVWISIFSTAHTDDESYWLLKLLGLPLREKPTKNEVIVEESNG